MIIAIDRFCVTVAQCNWKFWRSICN